MGGDDPRKILELYMQFQRQVGTIAGTVAVNWFKGSFAAQGFRQGGGQVDRWKARNPHAKRNAGRNILVDSGRLRRSIRIVGKGPGWAVVGTDVPYADAHNSGLHRTGKVTLKTFMRRSTKGRMHRVAGHTRNANTNIPRRQFLGNSEGLNAGIAAELAKRLTRLGF